MVRSALIKAIFNLKVKIKIDWSAEFSANRMRAFHHARRTERDGRNGRRMTRTMESIPAAQARCSVDLATQTSGPRGNFVRTNVGSGKKCRYKRCDMTTLHYDWTDRGVIAYHSDNKRRSRGNWRIHNWGQPLWVYKCATSFPSTRF